MAWYIGNSVAVPSPGSQLSRVMVSEIVIAVSWPTTSPLPAPCERADDRKIRAALCTQLSLNEGGGKCSPAGVS